MEEIFNQVYYYNEFNSNHEIRRVINFISNTISRGCNCENRNLMRDANFNPLTNSYDKRVSFNSKFIHSWAAYDYEDNNEKYNYTINIEDTTITWNLFLHIKSNEYKNLLIDENYTILYSMPCKFLTNDGSFEIDIMPWYNNTNKEFQLEFFEIFKQLRNNAKVSNV